jgi:2-amino-4-hydroxy-6-hydroxymethyldihydropteridine diphosphokinase
MKKAHRFYLNIGSNIQPEMNLPKTIDLLRAYGEVQAVSNAWETHAVGAQGPNFLNASVIFLSQLDPDELKLKIIGAIEVALGRVRSPDKNAPRTIDIDIIMVDGKPFNIDRWNNPFVVVPMSELAPELEHPIDHKKLAQVAERMSSQTWIKMRPEILNQRTEDY